MDSFTGWGIERYKIMKKAMLQIQQEVFDIVRARYPECECGLRHCDKEMVLTKQDSEVFAQALIDPPEPNHRLGGATEHFNIAGYKGANYAHLSRDNKIALCGVRMPQLKEIEDRWHLPICPCCYVEAYRHD